MAQRALPRIACNKCYTAQQWRGQKECLNCGKPLNNWSVASQLRAQDNNPTPPQPPPAT
jgi:hypothetical protein